MSKEVKVNEAAVPLGLSTEVSIETSGYLALQNFNMAAAIQEEMAGLDLTFDKIKVPSGGGINFELPTDDPDSPDSVKEFSGVIVFQHPLRMYYMDKYTGANNPPNCGSFDAITGIGNPGGSCAKCPLNLFGSAEDRAGKACKDRRRIYILREGEIFPLLLSLPTGSLKNMTTYIKRLLSKQRKTGTVVTKFTLKKAINANGIPYSQAVFTFERELKPEEQAVISKMTEQIKALAMRVGFEEDNSHDTEGDIPNIDPETGEIIEQ